MKKRVNIWSIAIVNLCILGILITTAALGSRAVTAFVENKPLAVTKCVIIDAGHGGVDGGATSCTGILESNINLEIALRLHDLMCLLGIHTKMIRTTDVSVYTKGESIAAKKVSDLKRRVEIVNDTANALLISIHQNHYSDSKYSGAQVFFAPSDRSKSFAVTMQQAMVTALNPGSRRKSKKADGVYLLQNIDCPGILIECGFLSNPQEEAKLRSEEYQKKLCAVIAATTNSYLYSGRVS